MANIKTILNGQYLIKVGAQITSLQAFEGGENIVTHFGGGVGLYKVSLQNWILTTVDTDPTFIIRIGDYAGFSWEMTSNNNSGSEFSRMVIALESINNHLNNLHNTATDWIGVRNI